MPVKTTQCPFCKEDILADAVLCKHCGSRLKAQGVDHGGTCPYCKESINPEATRCKHCRSDLGASPDDRGGCGCGGGCAGCGSSQAYSLTNMGAGLQPVSYRREYGVGGECYNRCMLYCSGPACEWICGFICEHAPVTTRPDMPQFLLR